MTSSDSGSDTSSPPAPPPNSLAGLSLSIFADLLSNLTHDIALQTHRAEKLLRTRQQRLLLLAASPLPTAAQTPTTTPNSLAVIPAEILCERCRLPQHALGTLDTAGAKKKFCSQQPWHNSPLHDIYGNPFPTIKDKGKSDKNNNSTFAVTDSPAEDTPGSTVPRKKGNSAGDVYFECTSCGKDKVLSNRYAAHLEKCLGLAGRKSSRAAMAKMNSNSGSASGINSPMLAPTDAPKTASRKPSPDKKSKSPVPNLTEDPPALPAKPSFVPLVGAGSATGTAVTSTPKKKKKKVTAAAAADLPLPLSTPSKIDVPPLPPLPPSVAPVAMSTQKKRKRKTEAAVVPPAVVGDLQGVGDGGDSSITVSKPPVTKKQKLSLAEKAEKAEKMDRERSLIGEGAPPMKKNQVNKFKNGRANSPSHGGGVLKKDGRTSSPSLLASPPTTHKPLPPRPSTLSGNLLGSPPPSVTVTPKPRKPKPGTLGASASAKKFADGSVKKNGKPKLKKGINVGASSAVGAGGTVAGKTVPRVGGKSVPVPGVARKGVKE